MSAPAPSTSVGEGVLISNLPCEGASRLSCSNAVSAADEQRDHVSSVYENSACCVLVDSVRADFGWPSRHDTRAIAWSGDVGVWAVASLKSTPSASLSPCAIESGRRRSFDASGFRPKAWSDLMCLAWACPRHGSCMSACVPPTRPRSGRCAGPGCRVRELGRDLRVAAG
jgi:hypothetical protein